MLGICILSVLFAFGAGLFAFTRTLEAHSASDSSQQTASVLKPEGTAWFYDTRGQDDSVEVHITALPRAAKGMVYVAWLVNPYRPDQVLMIGSFTPDRTGTVSLRSDQRVDFNPQVQSLRHIFSKVVVTLEKAEEQWQKPIGTPVVQGSLNISTLTTLTPIFVRSLYTPKQVALLMGLHTQTRAMARWLANMVEAQQHGDSANVRIDVLRLLYLLEGTHGVDVTHLNLAGQQNVASSGDGVGLLSATTPCKQDQHGCGYLDMVRAAVQTLMTQQLVPRPVAQKILTTLATMSQLAQRMQQISLPLATLSKLDTPTLRLLATLENQLDALLNGSDHNGDGNIDPIAGEAATAQLYTYVQQLGAIELR